MICFHYFHKEQKQWGKLACHAQPTCTDVYKLKIKLLVLSREYKRGKYHCTIDLLFDCFGLVCFANKKKNCQL
jgi:hypothetical protein